MTPDSETTPTNPDAGFISFDELKSVDDRERKTIYVERWEKNVLMRALSAGERENFETELIRHKDHPDKLKGTRARLLATVLINEDGSPLIPDKNIAVLQARHAKVIADLFEDCIAMNAMTKEEVEGIEENSEATSDVE